MTERYSTQAIACGLSDVAGWLENEGWIPKHVQQIHAGAQRLRELDAAQGTEARSDEGGEGFAGMKYGEPDDEEDDPDEPIPGFDCSPFGMSPVLMNYRLRKQSRPFSAEDRSEAAALIDRLVAEIETLESAAQAGEARQGQDRNGLDPKDDHAVVVDDAPSLQSRLTAAEAARDEAIRSRDELARKLADLESRHG